MEGLNYIFKKKLTEEELIKIKQVLNQVAENEYFIDTKTGNEINVLEIATKTIIKIMNNKYTSEELENIINSLFEENNSVFLRRILSESELVNLQQILFWHQKEISTLFDGKLKEKERIALINAGVTTEKLQLIEEFLEKYKDSLSGFTDIVGDDAIPTEQFYFNIKHIAHLLDNDPKKVISRNGVLTRKYTTAKLVKTLALNFMSSDQIFENRKAMQLNKEKWEKEKNNLQKDDKIILPKEPVLWISNHHFKDDALATIRGARSVYMVFGSIPLYLNTFDGILTYLIGALLVNRKSVNSKQALKEKIKKAIDYKADIDWYVEGVHNKTPNELILYLWEYFYEIAVEKNIKIMTETHYIKDPTQKIDKEKNPIHTIVDGPFDLSKFTKEEGIAFIRNNLATWYYLMAEKFGNCTREELLAYYQKRAIEVYGANVEDFIKTSKRNPEDIISKPITAQEAFEIYLRDYKTTVSGYDSTIESGPADFRPSSITRPEDVYESIANLKLVNPDEVYAILSKANANKTKNVWNAIEASELVRTRKLEDYQRRRF